MEKCSAMGLTCFFISNFALNLHTKLPLVDIKGKTSINGLKTGLKIKIRLSIIPKFIFPFALGSIVLFYFLDKYTDSDFGGISDSTFPLLSIPFVYVFSLTMYLIES